MNAETIVPNKEADRRADWKLFAEYAELADAGASPPGTAGAYQMAGALGLIIRNSPSDRLVGLAHVASTILTHYVKGRIGWDDAYSTLKPVSRIMRKIIRSRGYPNHTYT